MQNSLINKANEIISILKEIPTVKGCVLYGSLSTNTYDEFSDIDIEVDVSGSDNGQFMLDVAYLLKNRVDIWYSDYAPSLIPDKYIVSLAIDAENPFRIIDLCCYAEPHCTTVTKQQAAAMNDKCTHILKVWIANLKHYVRGQECYDDIAKMARRLSIADVDVKEEAELLEETLCWLEENHENNLYEYIQSCRRVFEELVK